MAARTGAVSSDTATVGASFQDAQEQAHVLAVDNDPQTLRLVLNAVSRAGYVPVVTGDPKEALSLLQRENPHLVLLDSALPAIDGIDLMNDMVAVSDVPVIFLSAYWREANITRAPDTGAADYVVKPFSPMELAARIRAALRKREAPERIDPFILEDLAVHHAERRVTFAGRPVRLTAIEYQMLAELAANAGQVLTYEHLLLIWAGKSAESNFRSTRPYSSA